MVTEAWDGEADDEAHRIGGRKPGLPKSCSPLAVAAARSATCRAASPLKVNPEATKSDGTPARLKVCLTASPGGHVSELEMLAGSTSTEDTFLVTVETPQTRSVFPGIRRRFVHKIERNPANFLLNAAEAFRILVSERPDVVVSTGAGDAVPLMLLSACLGIPVVFVESIARVLKPSTTGRAVRRWVDLTIIPWASLQTAYPRGVSVACMVHAARPNHSFPGSPSIVVLTGTGPRGYNRLLREVDRLVSRKQLTGLVYAQIGASTYVPRNYAYVRFLPHDELVKVVESSDVVITHCGAGSICESLEAGKPTIVVPRDPRFGEVLYNSRAELAKHLESLQWVTIAEHPTDIPEAIERARRAVPSPPPSGGPHASEVLDGFLNSLRCKSAGQC